LETKETKIFSSGEQLRRRGSRGEKKKKKTGYEKRVSINERPKEKLNRIKSRGFIGGLCAWRGTGGKLVQEKQKKSYE